MFPIDDLGAWLFKGLIAVCFTLLSWLGWLFRTQSKKVDDHDREIAELKSLSVSEDKVREIVKETIDTAVDPIHDSIKRIEDLVRSNTEIVKQLELRAAREEGRQELLKELKAVGSGH